MQALPERVWGVMSNDTLLAVPFFTFMGLILERSGMAEDLLDTIGQVFGPVRGGLAYAVIFVGALLAATTGVVAASVISMGLISLPIMLRYGYDRRFASGVIAASGTLAQIIPPSLVLIIMADQLGKSVGDMYAGAFIPGITLACLYAVYAFGVCDREAAVGAGAAAGSAHLARAQTARGGTRSLLVLTIVAAASAIAFAHWKYGPDDPTDEMLVVATSVGTGVAFVAAVLNRLFKLGLLSRLAERVSFVLIPPLALIFLVLGTIFLGVATPTEGGAMGASGALIMALARRRLSWKLLRQAMDTTAKLSTFVVFILVGARVFSLTFYGVNGHVWVEQLLLQPARRAAGLPDRRQHPDLLPGVLPRLLRAVVHRHSAGRAGRRQARHRPDLVRRAARRQHADLVHASAVRLRAVLPAQRRAGQGLPRQAHRQAHRRVTTGQIYWGAVPFVLIQIVMIGLVIAFPQMVMVYKAKERRSTSTRSRSRSRSSPPGNQPPSRSGSQSEYRAGRGREGTAERVRRRARSADKAGDANPSADRTTRKALRKERWSRLEEPNKSKKRAGQSRAARRDRHPARRVDVDSTCLLLHRVIRSAAIMKLSKRFSATREPRDLVGAEFLPRLVDLRELRVLGGDLVVELSVVAL